MLDTVFLRWALYVSSSAGGVCQLAFGGAGQPAERRASGDSESRSLVPPDKKGISGDVYCG